MKILIAKYLSVFFNSMFKFLLGPITGVAVGLSVLETFLLTVSGMMTTVVLVSFLGGRIKTWWNKRNAHKKSQVFSKKNRRVVTIWSRFGIQGLAFLTPILLSPILGTMLAVSFGETRARIYWYMFISALFWGITMSVFFHFVGDKVAS
jgi:uncharacterized membrane protein